MGVHCDICSFKCWGIDGYDGSCCTIEDRDYIIGPIKDYETFLNSISQKIGRKVSFDEVFYTYEEGSKLFPHLSSWQDKESYPSFKVQFDLKRKPCIFYNSTLKCCSVYDIRPETCRNYNCGYLKEVLDKSIK